MKRSNNIFKYLLIFLFATILLDPIYGGYGGEGSKTKPEKIKKYKTPNLVRYVNLSVFYLNSTKNINKRHLKVFTNCQRLFNSGKNKVKGQEIKYLKSCQNLMRTGLYSKEAFAIIQESTNKSNPSKKGIINNSKFITESKIENPSKNKKIEIKKRVSIDTPIESFSNNINTQNVENTSIKSQIKNASNSRTDNKNIKTEKSSENNINNKQTRNRKNNNKDTSNELIKEVKRKRNIKSLKEDSELFFY